MISTQTNAHDRELAEAKTMVQDRLTELGKLERDWDSYGGASPLPAVLRTVELLLNDLVHRYGPELGHASLPSDIFPNPDGGIELEWTRGDRMLGVEISPRETRYLVKIGRGADAVYEKGLISTDASEVNRLLAKLR